jgi:3-hydroxyacyl-CoA dehydrogenase/enoyl-CoA hydratase/3-hydroxybutyryl-CoA epimerase
MIDLDIGDDGIATITWNMTDKSMNVLDAASTAAFADAVNTVVEDEAVTGVIVTSAKRDFIAGADLFSMIQADDAQTVFDMSRGFHALSRTMETCGKPFVAALPGTALGGGLEIALACHRRIAADNPKALFGQPEVTVGLLPGAGGTQRLPRMIGARAALPLMIEGRKLNAKAALKAGIIDAVVPADKLLDEARAWLKSDDADATQPWDRKGYRIPGGAVFGPSAMQTFVAGTALSHAKSRGNYPAVQAIMSCVYEGLLVDIDTGLKAEARWFTSLALGPVAKNMIRSLFINMGAANKLAGRPEGVPNAEYAKIGILGAGMMGAGIAYSSAMAGLDVVLLDSEQALADRGKAYSEKLLAKRVERGRLDEAGRDAILAKIHPTTDYADLAGCDLVIEAVFENRAIKADVTSKTEAVIAEDVIFASNTSTLPITGLAEASARPANFIGLHFFSPVDKMPLVEIIRGKETSDACLARAMDYVKRIRKTPIVVNDSRGFYTSRVFGTYVREGMAMLEEGVSPALIENAGRMTGMPVGPLAVGDEVSIELMHKVAMQTKADMGDDYISPVGESVMTAMVETLGRLGRKAGKGFYDYPEGAKKKLWPGLAEQFPHADEQPDVEEVKNRLLYVQAIETARCLEEGVLTSAADADIGSILGWGFPAYAGGTLSLIDMVGAEDFVAACDRLAQRFGNRFTPPKLLRDMAAKGDRFHDDSKLAA